MSAAAPRYALYYAPDAETALWRFGSSIIGYDAARAADLPVPDLPGFDAESWHALTAEPRRYGFHGTLKAPFRLAADAGAAALETAAADLAKTCHPFSLPPLEAALIGPFVALVPKVPCPQLGDLAETVTLGLDPFRAALTPAEIARRRPERLSARQAGYLAAHGYPYVREEFRFHMTLTGPLPEGVRDHAFNALRDAFAGSGAATPIAVTELCLFVQPAPGERFRLKRRFPLGGDAPRRALKY